MGDLVKIILRLSTAMVEGAKTGFTGYIPEWHQQQVLYIYTHTLYTHSMNITFCNYIFSL